MSEAPNIPPPPDGSAIVAQAGGIPPPPDGSAIIASGQNQSPPPAQTAPDKGYASPVDAAGQIADLIGGAAKSVAKISGPNVIYELLRKNFPHLNLPQALGMPNANEVMANGLEIGRAHV